VATSDTTDLFSPEATAALEAGGREGKPLALSPAWVARSYWLLVAGTLAAVLFTALAHVGDYARGPAVVRVDGRLDLTSAAGGIVLSVDVEPGTAVTAGQRLVRFHAEPERRELEQMEREFELKLVRILLHPDDEVTRQSLAALRAAREMAAARLRDRLVVAPQAGVVRNLRIRPGQLLNPGDVVLTLVDESQSAFTVVALVPGQFRPMLKRGLPLRFTLDGHPQATADLQVEAIGDEVVGPSEMRRYLGQELGDTLPDAVQGGLVLVRARLPMQTFALDGQRYRFYDGIPGRVDVRVRSLRLAALLFPALKQLAGHGS
jgi:multidrug efflux pump subunit AcrA (membrane-fusion protein)